MALTAYRDAMQAVLIEGTPAEQKLRALFEESAAIYRERVSVYDRSRSKETVPSKPGAARCRYCRRIINPGSQFYPIYCTEVCKDNAFWRGAAA